jgi:N,N'-diacetyllegionaminate synthase
VSLPVSVIAEAAQGYEGDPFIARLLVRAAAAGQADMVKFQLVYADELATPEYAYYGLFKQLEMSHDAWTRVVADARDAKLGIVFDVYGLESLGVARALGADAVKIHATDFFNEPLADAAIGSMPRVFFSTGGITVDEIDAFLARHPAARERLTLLYGFQAEPTALEDNHLRRLTTLRARFPGLALGFMDHADGEGDEAGWLGVLAVALGASVVEKHVTLDRAVALEDSVSALSAKELARYVGRLRAAERALGAGELALTTAETEYRNRAIKVIVAARPLTRGHVLAPGDVRLLRTARDNARTVFRRPGEVQGRTLARDVARGEALHPEDLA